MARRGRNTSVVRNTSAVRSIKSGEWPQDDAGRPTSQTEPEVIGEGDI